MGTSFTRFFLFTFLRALFRIATRKHTIVRQERALGLLEIEVARSRTTSSILAREVVAKNIELEAMGIELKTLALAATLDPLTGVYNRRGADAELHRTLGAFERQDYRASGEVVQHQLSVLVMDLNHFKKVNDKHGHAAGDRVLVAVAEHLRAAFRPEDIVLRKGGDEFVVYLINASRGNAIGSAERFRQRLLEDERLCFGEIQVSVSIGISHGSFTTKRGGMQIIDDVEKLADAAMYGAKEESRGFSGIVVAADAVYSDTAFGGL